MTTEKLTFERTVNAPPAQAYRAFTNSTAFREWFCDVSLADPRPGGRLYFWWNAGHYASGEFTALAEDKSVTFTWYGKNEPAPTQVQISLKPQDGGTSVTVVHSDIGTDEAWEETRKQFERGWENALENLESVLETGQDLRFVRRPMLGIFLDEFNKEIAAQLGVPVTEGVRLSGVVEGMGAQVAGLQKDDIVVGIAGAEVTDFASLSEALASHRSDDEVEVLFFRGGEKQSAAMVLSRRPLPEVPESPEALSQAAREIYVELDAELDRFFEGVSDEEASYRPAPDQWSVKETLAHLIVGERGWHTFLSHMIDDHEPVYDPGGGNVPARHAAVIAAYPTIPEMLEELKRNELETVALLAALPPEFVARRGSFNRVSYYVLELPGFHTRQHLEQMREAVEEARSGAS
jgi:uncharacterized protein YndB with AHSA1/START domain